MPRASAGRPANKASCWWCSNVPPQGVLGEAQGRDSCREVQPARTAAPEALAEDACPAGALLQQGLVLWGSKGLPKVSHPGGASRAQQLAIGVPTAAPQALAGGFAQLDEGQQGWSWWGSPATYALARRVPLKFYGWGRLGS